MRLSNICDSEKANNLQSTLYVHTWPPVYTSIHVCLCVSLFLAGSRYDPKSYRCSRRLSRNPEAASVSRAGRGRVCVCGPFLFMKLPINARWQGFPFHSSTCPIRDHARHTLFLSLFLTFQIFIIIFFPLSRYIIIYFFLTKI